MTRDEIQTLGDLFESDEVFRLRRYREGPAVTVEIKTSGGWTRVGSEDRPYVYADVAAAVADIKRNGRNWVELYEMKNEAIGPIVKRVDVDGVDVPDPAKEIDDIIIRLGW